MISDLAAPAPFFLLPMPIAMVLHALAALSRAVIAYPLAELSQPDLCPGKLGTQYRKPNRNDHDRRSGGNYHDDTDSEYGAAKSEYRDPACNFVGYLDCLIHFVLPVIRIGPLAYQATLSFFTPIT